MFKLPAAGSEGVLNQVRKHNWFYCWCCRSNNPQKEQLLGVTTDPFFPTHNTGKSDLGTRLNLPYLQYFFQKETLQSHFYLNKNQLMLPDSVCAFSEGPGWAQLPEKKWCFIFGCAFVHVTENRLTGALYFVDYPFAWLHCNWKMNNLYISTESINHIQ